MILDFPIDLPDDLFTELDCAESSTQFAGFRLDVGRERLLRYSGVSIRLCPNEWVFFALLTFPPVAEWLLTNKVELATGGHWFLYDYFNRKPYVADEQAARRCLDTQTLPKVQNGRTRRVRCNG